MASHGTINHPRSNPVFISPYLTGFKHLTLSPTVCEVPWLFCSSVAVNLVCWIVITLPCSWCFTLHLFLHVILPLTSPPAWSSWQCWLCAAPRPSSRNPQRSPEEGLAWLCRHSDDGSHQCSWHSYSHCQGHLGNKRKTKVKSMLN